MSATPTGNMLGNMSTKGAALAALMQQRLTAVTEEICALFVRTIAEYEEELAHSKEEIQRKQQLLDCALNPAVHIHRYTDVQIHPSTKELTPSLDQEDPPSSKQEECFTHIPDLPVRDAQSQTGSKDKVHVKKEPVCDDENQINRAVSPVEQHDGEPNGTSGSEEHQGVSRSLKRKTTSQSPVRRSPQKRIKRRKRLKLSNGRKKSKDFKCDECPKAFGAQAHLLRHVNVHRKRELKAAQRESKRASRNPGFPCSVCQKWFDGRCALETHMGVHTNWKLSSYELVRQNELYHCPICKEGFRRKVDVVAHFRAAHSKPFRCSLCRNKYTTEAALRKHARLHTGQATVFNCHFCCKTFVGRTYFRKHMEQHSANEDSASGIPFSMSGM